MTFATARALSIIVGVLISSPILVFVFVPIVDLICVRGVRVSRTKSVYDWGLTYHHVDTRFVDRAAILMLSTVIWSHAAIATSSISMIYHTSYYNILLPIITIYFILQSTMSLDYLISQRLQEISIRHNPTTLKNKKSLILNFRCWLAEFLADEWDLPINNITNQMMYRYDHDMSLKYVRWWMPTWQYRALVKTMYEFFEWSKNKWQYTHEVIRHSTKQITRTKFHEIVPKDIDRILERIENCRARKLIKARDMAIFRLMLYAGVRRVEVTRIRQCDVDYERCIIKIHGKWGKVRDLPVSEKLVMQYIRHWMRIRCLFSSEYVFCSTGQRWWQPLAPDAISDIVRWYGELAGVNCTPHCLRVSYQNMMRRSGTDRTVIMWAMGHSSEKTSRWYDRISLVDQVQAVERLENSIYH